VRPEFRHADLSVEEVVIVNNLAATGEELGPDRSLAARDLVDRLLAALKPAERLVVDLLYLQQRSVVEIQSLTGWGASLVKVRAFRARQKMRRQLEQFTVEGER
jgi:RNA polymerase sigma-70 factor (ECF subfamily)